MTKASGGGGGDGGGGGGDACKEPVGGLISGVQHTHPSEQPMLESPGYIPPAFEHVVSGSLSFVCFRHLPYTTLPDFFCIPQSVPHTGLWGGGGGGYVTAGSFAPQQKQEFPEHPMARCPRYIPPTFSHSSRPFELFPWIHRPYVIEESEFSTPHRESGVHWEDTSIGGGGGNDNGGDVSGAGDTSGGGGDIITVDDPPQQ